MCNRLMLIGMTPILAQLQLVRVGRWNRDERLSLAQKEVKWGEGGRPGRPPVSRNAHDQKCSFDARNRGSNQATLLE